MIVVLRALRQSFMTSTPARSPESQRNVYGDVVTFPLFIVLTCTCCPCAVSHMLLHDTRLHLYHIT